MMMMETISRSLPDRPHNSGSRSRRKTGPWLRSTTSRILRREDSIAAGSRMKNGRRGCSFSLCLLSTSGSRQLD
jgi:hypothetical protein